MTITIIWMVSHNNEQPVFFTSEDRAKVYANELLEKKTNNFDGSEYLDGDSYLGVTGFYVNHENSPCLIAIGNLYTKEKINANNSIHWEKRRLMNPDLDLGLEVDK